MEKRTGAAQRSRQAHKPPQRGNGSRILVVIAVVLAVMIVGVGCGFLTATLNTKQDLEDVRPAASSQIYDINGNELANVHAEQNRVPVKISQVPEHLKDAFIAVEDVRFYDHAGVDPKGIMRALIANITNKGVAEGGSTITQQLAKNAYLTQDRTYKRKIQEIFLALQLERRYTKDEILELYLNQIYFGQGAYGVQAAAKTYFGKDVKDLDLNECAMLAGIPKSPNYFSPLNNLQAAQERKGVVLDQMAKYGYISSSTASKTKAESLNLVKPQKQDTTGLAAYFIDYVTQLMIEKYGADAVYQEGLKIYTTLDVDMQKAAEAAMQNLPTYSTDGSGNKQPQGALVAIEPSTGYIKAMVGGRGTDQFNRATMAERQPGSSFKPFVFAAALENGLTPSSTVEDKPINIGGWQPQNYSRNFNGTVTMRYVAEQSLNVPTIKIAQEVGMEKIIYLAEKMGITTFVKEGSANDMNYAVSIGGMTKGVTPLEMTSAYGTFANDGVHVEPVAIVKVLNQKGEVLEEAHPKSEQVLKKSTANNLTSMLMGVIARGTGTRANIGRPAAGKTGTTDNYQDAWFVGYVPDLVTGVWVGCDDNARMGSMTGGTTPATIWKAFMSKVVQGMPNKNFNGAYLTSVEKPAKTEDKKDDKDKDKDGKEQKQGKDAKPKEAGKSGEGNAPAVPAQEAVPAPTAPSPVPGGGGKKAN
ncbi:MAG: penicillin-binding protein 1A [Anaerovibrio sp.]|uniref:transglycosylase domain-containing protein n=1 Tax=Anaerovibrio sp. TaxID=1872532 RepID=UPI002609D534|nr:penicillin-binding protein 1A [Anaerovibrio sp.]MDD7677599.1 penicillin-binding protein 1A [Anaerovibrio sp.]MDY2604270.1 penicillin-binding protein 1A [Anaerovibrio sp.]